ncbi:MAG: NIL domain-containing protein [Armatimonadetes bacterium]|nr:NIL domain-containing protein [Armatimonadota bacterium]
MTTVDIQLTARGEQVTQPWLCRLCREFDVEVNLVKASIEPDFGWVHLQLTGPVEMIQRATAWLMTTGLHVDALQRSVGVPK